jgi:hypothetical protein
MIEEVGEPMNTCCERTVVRRRNAETLVNFRAE